MGSAWASARLTALVIGTAAALVGCAPDPAPVALVGTWYSEDEQLAGRTLEIDSQWIRFMQGQQELSAIQVRAVTQEGSGDGPIHLEIEGTDREGLDATLSFEIELRPQELLRMETQLEPWRRAPRGSHSKAPTVPWQRKPRAPDPGGET